MHVYIICFFLQWMARYALVQLQIEFLQLECNNNYNYNNGVWKMSSARAGMKKKRKRKGNSSGCFSFSRRVQMQIIWWLLQVDNLKRHCLSSRRKRGAGCGLTGWLAGWLTGWWKTAWHFRVVRQVRGMDDRRQRLHISSTFSHFHFHFMHLSG